ncbi:TetR/AcrR family transcriptional regulator [Sphingomonas sp. CCH13-B11]|nr:TetR/AcrR family transcriptional regulator [Sphingomonas sp. CCH13-B11]
MTILYLVKTSGEAAMRVSQQEKARSRARIVDSASRAFRARGVEGASVGDVMKEAGLTHGGFYRHFESKDALLAAALEAAFAEMIGRVTDGLQAEAPDDVRRAFQTFYLSAGHLAAPETGCPAGALSGDIARADGAVKRAFGGGLLRMIDAFAATFTGSSADPRREAMREFAMLVGAVMLARASDPEMAGTILRTCGASDEAEAAA